jgi:uncharacterized membrane protein YdjX (TVP38/TMEM64 family)
MRRFAGRQRLILAGVVLAGLCALAVPVLSRGEIFSVLDPVGMLETGWAWVRGSHPMLFFMTLSVATLFPIPISVFYVAAGPLYGVGPALRGSFFAVAANMTLAHWATSSLLRPFAARVMERLGYTIPTVNPDDQGQTIIVTRVTPGIPYFAQNLILGLIGVDYWRYLAISLPIQMLWATGFVLLGDSAMRGRFGAALSALGLLIVAGYATKWMHRRFAARGPAELDPALEPQPGEAS